MLKLLILSAAEGFTSAGEFSEPVRSPPPWYSVDLFSFVVLTFLIVWFTIVIRAVKVTRPPDMKSLQALKELKKNPVKKRD